MWRFRAGLYVEVPSVENDVLIWYLGGTSLCGDVYWASMCTDYMSNCMNDFSPLCGFTWLRPLPHRLHEWFSLYGLFDVLAHSYVGAKCSPPKYLTIRPIQHYSVHKCTFKIWCMNNYMNDFSTLYGLLHGQ